MEYKDFLCATIFRLTKFFGDKADIDIYESLKNNGSIRKGIIIKEKDNNIGPVIYMDEFYERFNKGVPLEIITNDVIRFYNKIICPYNWKCDEIMNFECIKDKLAVKLINYTKNKEYLKSYPNIRYLDLSVIFYVVLEIKKEGIATVVISYDQMDKWGISKRELFDLAVKNSCRILPAKFSSMQDTLKELMYDNEEDISGEITGEEDVMYVLTNDYKNCGAACIIYNGVLDMIGDILKRNFFIIPSSIHEVIIVPATENVNPMKLDEIINDINGTLVPEEEFLGNHCYIYDRITKEVGFGCEWKLNMF